MARNIINTWFPLLLVGLSALASGCVAAGDETDEENSDQTEDAAVVSSITEGDYVIHSVTTNKCINVAGASAANGAKLQEWDCNSANAQKFHIAPTSGGYFKIINVNSNKAFDIAGASTASSALLQQWSYSGGTNQQFKFVARGNKQFSIHPRHAGNMGIDLSYGHAANGTIIAQFPYAGWTNQLWTFNQVSTTTGGGTGLGAILSRSMFATMFPNRSSFYTYDALVAAAATFPAFATTGTADTRKREVAAFLANVSHETGGLVYIEEIAKATYCDTSWGPAGCSCATGKQYFGRGPIQLSWNGNYCAAGAALGLPLQSKPELLSQDAKAAWRTGFWFWTTQTGAGSMTSHNAIINGKGFGETIRTINGALECGGKNTAQMQNRVDAYVRFTGLLGVSPGSNTGC